ncbi:MAG: HD domain-containing protein [Spirochaetales bacterium]|nr:HD domain-containing protein [Spirochaetales bacterium]
MFLIVLNDISHANQLIHTGLFMPAGFFIFIFSQTLVIISRSTMLLHTIENQRNELLESQDLFERSRLGTILGLAKLAEYRDQNTGAHLERIREYCRLLAVELSKITEYSQYITDRYINDLYQSAILHDIGKVGVPDSVLLNTGKLNEDEFKQIQQHTRIGGDAIQNIESRINMKTFLTLGKEIAYYHHEKWDGSGYPKGLKGYYIPLSARITAIADVYDALTSERPYKNAFPHEKAVSIIIEGRGTHFDPLLVDIFLNLKDEFKRISCSLQEDPQVPRS